MVWTSIAILPALLTGFAFIGVGLAADVARALLLVVLSAVVIGAVTHILGLQR